MPDTDNEAELIAALTHLSEDEAELLLTDRTLSLPTGIDPEDDGERLSSHVVVTETDVALKHRRARSTPYGPTAIELAESTGASIEQVRRDQQAAAEMLEFTGEDTEE